MTDQQFYLLLGSIWSLSGMHRSSCGTVAVGTMLMIIAFFSK